MRLGFVSSMYAPCAMRSREQSGVAGERPKIHRSMDVTPQTVHKFHSARAKLRTLPLLHLFFLLIGSSIHPYPFLILIPNNETLPHTPKPKVPIPHARKLDETGHRTPDAAPGWDYSCATMAHTVSLRYQRPRAEVKKARSQMYSADH